MYYKHYFMFLDSQASRQEEVPVRGFECRATGDSAARHSKGQRKDVECDNRLRLHHGPLRVRFGHRSDVLSARHGHNVYCQACVKPISG